MKRFFRAVDFRSRSAMADFLQSHFRYPTMNSWNRSTSYACNLKIHNLKLVTEIADKLYDMICTQEFFSAQSALLADFGEQHGYCWQAGMNGRSGGYLVLYQGELKPSGYKSYCPRCGQKNYQEATASNNTCGVCRQPTRMNFPHTHMQVVTYPGRGTDDGEDYEDWSMYELRERVKLVQELERLADRMVDKAIHLVRHYDVAEEEFFVSQTRKVLVKSAV